ncbi:hypothetical protein Pelo_17041 [Pelomyxa schiedti]|nr:hypothetical protein Pelo_17041 [Pelomyxa schiedti]
MSQTPGEVVVDQSVIVDARAQFVAFACATIVGRCGVASPARVLAGAQPVVEDLGRSWVAGPSRIVGFTSVFQDLPPSGPIRKKLHVFLGLSATLGVVWCRPQTHSTWWPDDGNAMIAEDVQGNIGGGMFIATSYYPSERSATCVVDSFGRLVARLAVGSGDDASAIVDSRWQFVCNSKWVVMVEAAGDTQPRLTLWNLTRLWLATASATTTRASGGDTICGGAVVKCNVNTVVGWAQFPRFGDPCGDEIVMVGNDEEVGCVVSFVDLQRSSEAGVSVVTSRCVIPHPNPIGLVWESPETLLTLHRPFDYCVYNAKTENVPVRFLTTKYQCVRVIQPAHIGAVLRSRKRSSGGARQKISVVGAEVTSKLATHKGVFTVEKTTVGTKVRASVSVHDAITGICLATLTVTWPKNQTKLG